MDVWDIIITPAFFFFIMAIAFIYVRRNRKNELIRKYFLPALVLRLVGGILFGLVYQFYYKGGDTFTFWSEVKILNSILFSNPLAFIRMFFEDLGSTNLDMLQYSNLLWIYNDKSSFFVVKTASFLSLFAFNTYSSTSLLFAILSFSGSWKLFVTLREQYPHITSQLAFATLFIPSIVFWGSGIMKDTLCLIALCYLYSSFYELIAQKRNFKKNILIIYLSGYVLYKVKLYILISFFPALIIWLFLKYNNEIRSKAIRNFSRPMIILIALIAGLVGSSLLSATNDSYNFENIEMTSKMTASYIKYQSLQTGGSVYDLGDVKYTLVGLLKIFPAGVNVTLFRPYIWEVKNIVMIFSSLEAMFFLGITIITIFKNGPVGLIKKINEDPFVLSALIFSLIFAFAVGISTNNFGSLVRYKIPVLPFYMSCIYIMRYNPKKDKNGIDL
jgi:hypothetical protein